MTPIEPQISFVNVAGLAFANYASSWTPILSVNNFVIHMTKKWRQIRWMPQRGHGKMRQTRQRGRSLWLR